MCMPGAPASLARQGRCAEPGGRDLPSQGLSIPDLGHFLLEGPVSPDGHTSYRRVLGGPK